MSPATGARPTRPAGAPRPARRAGVPRSARSAADWARAAEHLAGRDPLAARLHRRHGAPTGIRATPPAERFASLCESIVYQQLHGRAAASIWARVAATVAAQAPGEATAAAGFRADAVLRTEPDSLRAAGLSAAKAAAILDLAHHCDEGLVELERTGRMSDAEVVEHLCVVRGIGPWTAQMFLLFDLGRLDVWPTGDLGVRNGWARAVGSQDVPSPADLGAAGDTFSPCRSVMAWWCWRETDVVLPDGP